MYVEKHKKNHVILNGGRNSQALKMQFLTFFPTLEAFTLSGNTEMNVNFTYSEKL